MYKKNQKLLAANTTLIKVVKQSMWKAKSSSTIHQKKQKVLQTDINHVTDWHSNNKIKKFTFLKSCMNAVWGTEFSIQGWKWNHLMYKTQTKICWSYQKIRDKKMKYENRVWVMRNKKWKLSFELSSNQTGLYFSFASLAIFNSDI